MGNTLKVIEIFRSLQGEGLQTGLPCVFIRLAACNLRCEWCDTEYAWHGGEDRPLDNILEQVSRMGCPRVELTGGEPLLQKATPDLLRILCEAGYEALLETNGSQDISVVDTRVRRIVDFKPPSSGCEDANLWSNAEHLTHCDEAKFVQADRTDFDFAREAIEKHDLLSRCTVTLSPVIGRLDPALLAAWILESGLDVRLGLQLHKILDIP